MNIIHVAFSHSFATVGCGFRTTMTYQTNVEKKQNGFKRFIVLPMGAVIANRQK